MRISETYRKATNFEKFQFSASFDIKNQTEIVEEFYDRYTHVFVGEFANSTTHSSKTVRGNLFFKSQYSSTLPDPLDRVPLLIEPGVYFPFSCFLLQI